jgi:hypothetical protein
MYSFDALSICLLDAVCLFVFKQEPVQQRQQQVLQLSQCRSAGLLTLQTNHQCLLRPARFRHSTGGCWRASHQQGRSTDGKLLCVCVCQHTSAYVQGTINGTDNSDSSFNTWLLESQEVVVCYGQVSTKKSDFLPIRSCTWDSRNSSKFLSIMHQAVLTSLALVIASNNCGFLTRQRQ